MCSPLIETIFYHNFNNNSLIRKIKQYSMCMFVYIYISTKIKIIYNKVVYMAFFKDFYFESTIKCIIIRSIKKVS